MTSVIRSAIACACMLAAAPSDAAEESTQSFEAGLIPSPHIFLPDGEVKGIVMLISDAAGWGDYEKGEADRLASRQYVPLNIGGQKGQLQERVRVPTFLAGALGKTLNIRDLALLDPCAPFVRLRERFDQGLIVSWFDDGPIRPVPTFDTRGTAAQWQPEWDSDYRIVVAVRYLVALRKAITNPFF